MRIDQLKITSPYKNLEGLEIDFDESRDVTVLLGRNGSAKSNLLEALITIFSSIERHRSSPFSFELKYIIDGTRVVLSAEVGHFARATADGKAIKQADLRARFTPRFLVGYYSGQSDRFETLYRPYDREALDDTLKAKLGSEDLKFRRFVNARPVHGLFALLAFYFSDDQQVQEFLRELPRIEAFDSLLVAVREPGWAKKGASYKDFWGAKGPVRVLLDRLLKYSLAPVVRTVRIDLDFRRSTDRECIYLYIPDIEALRQLAAEYERDARKLFQAFDTMRLSDLLDDFRVRVRVHGSTNSIHTRELSEGEQQLLTVLGLMRFTRNESSLYLLDEPDTHLNPTWGLEYLSRLRQIGQISEKSHTFLATHDPLLVAGLEKEEIRVLFRTADGRIRATEPAESPKGRGVAAALTSELFGLESQLDLASQGVLKEIYEITDKEELSADDRVRLENLRDQLPSLVPSDIESDPYRVLAKMAYEEAQNAVMTSEGRDAQWKRRALDRLRAKLIVEAEGQ